MRSLAFIRENILWKVLSLILAILVWLLINVSMANKDNGAFKFFDTAQAVREFKNLPIMMVSSSTDEFRYELDPRVVSVSIKAAGDVLEALKEGDIQVKADLTWHSGENPNRVILAVDVPQNVEIEEIIPQAVQVKVVSLPTAQNNTK